MSSKKSASRAAIDPGESTLERVIQALDSKPPYKIYFTIKLWDGSTKRVKLTGETKGILRAKGKQKVEDILSQGQDGSWSRSKSMKSFIEKVSEPYMNSRGLRENTRLRYGLALSQLKEEFGKRTIGDAVRFRALERVLLNIAQKHGSESARQARTVLGKYILDQLIREGLLEANPIRGVSIDLGSVKKTAKESSRVAIPDELYDSIVDHLIDRDVDRPLPPGKDRRFSSINKHKLIVALTLLQAGTGLRLSETLALTKADVVTSGKTLAFKVDEDVSKTHRARTVPILDDRIDKYWRERFESLAEGEDIPLIPAPGDPRSFWGRHNAAKASANLYKDLGTELESQIVENMRSHQWRTVLNNRAIARGVSPTVRAAFFGHDESMNDRSYTDMTDVSSMRAALSPGE